MARKLVTIDRLTPLLLPPSLQDWVESDDVVHLIIDAVEAIDESCCHYNWNGTGSSQYPPRMMLALLVYCYSSGIFSSRRIERPLRDVAVRLLTGDTHPDHDTIAAFRRENGVLFEACFVQVLALARRMKVGRLGDIAIDGSVVEANAAKRRTVSAEAIGQELAGLEETVAELTRRAEESNGRKPPTARRATGCPANWPRPEPGRHAAPGDADLEARPPCARRRARGAGAFDVDGPASLRAAPGRAGPDSTDQPHRWRSPPAAPKKGGSAPSYNVPDSRCRPTGRSAHRGARGATPPTTAAACARGRRAMAAWP